MTNQSSDTRKHFAYFDKCKDELNAIIEKVSAEYGLPPSGLSAGLQIFSAVPFSALKTGTAEAVYVSRVSSDPDEVWYELNDRQYSEDGIAHSVLSRWLWDGVGTDIPFERQYAVFTPIAGKAGEFQRIVHRTDEAPETTEKLSFSEAGDEVTLTFALNGPLALNYAEHHYRQQRTEVLGIK